MIVGNVSFAFDLTKNVYDKELSSKRRIHYEK
jgi:hypothetical protein